VRHVYASGFLAQFLREQEKKPMLLHMSDTPTIDQTKPRPTRGGARPVVKSTDKRLAKGPYSRLIGRGAVGAINGRSREGQFLRAYEQMLIKHCGGNPSVTQRALISRTARLALHLELMDERALLDGKGFGPTDHHFYVSWANALARHLDKLGLKRPAGYASATPADLSSILAEMDDVAR
jgi:hypothetical protein